MTIKNNFTLLLFFVLIPIFSFSQDKTNDQWKKREIGLQLVGLDNFDFDFLYKQQVEENAYRRISAGFVNMNLRDIGDDGSAAFSVGINWGREKRKRLSDKLNLAHGPTWIYNMALNANENNANANFSTGLGFILGVHYQLSDSFYIGAEVFPSILMGFSVNDDGVNNIDFNAGFSTRNVGISAVYKFVKN